MHNILPLTGTIRFAEASDLPQIVEIYNQGVAAGNANADDAPVTVDQRVSWFLDHDSNSFPVYIIELDQRIIGWGSLSSYRRGRNGLRATAEISYYIDYKYHGKGFGKKLIAHMISDASRLGIHHLFAIMLDINPVSENILKSFGFQKWGHLPNIVNLNGKICGQLIYGKNLIAT